ncbi:hypothetical protein TURU_000048 [Turdus rufiventris]|nr:hypothetical protein TURU_000048 [Turdus rufiventris]
MILELFPKCCFNNQPDALLALPAFQYHQHHQHHQHPSTAVGTMTPQGRETCMSQLPEQCRVPLISMYAFNLLLSALLMLISRTIIFIKVKSGSHQQQPKRFDIVICLSVLFTLPFSLRNLLKLLSYSIFSSQVVFLLTCSHSSIKPFIYFLAGRCWRPRSVGSLQLSLQTIFEKENPAGIDDPAMDSVSESGDSSY